MNLYLITGILISIVITIIYTIEDIRNVDCNLIEILIPDLTEGLIISLNWTMSIPILIIGNVILLIIKIIKEKEEIK